MTNSVNIRELVLELLLAITRDGEYSHIAISNVLNKYQYLDKKERAYITRVTEGTLERMIELDYIINQFSKVKVNKMKPVIRCIMRQGVYEMKYMDAIPPSATCNEMVKLAKKKGFHNLTGFVNGVLRNIGRGMDEVKYPAKEDNLVQALSVGYSMPEWIVKQWLLAYDAETVENILSSLQVEAPITIRTNLTKITPAKLRAELEAEGVLVKEFSSENSSAISLPYAFQIEGFDYLQALSGFRKGHFYVQDISSMMVKEIAQPKAGDYVIDVCAAPGGKSIHIAEALQVDSCESGKPGHVEARDLTAYKVELIEQNIARCQMTNIEAKCQDARILDEASIEKADIVIADLPCSGLGVMRKKKDIRYKMTPEKEKQLVKLQREILDTVHQYVKPGGALLYSTCTINREENEENVAWFLDTYPQFEVESMEQILPTVSAERAESCDGFFIAKLRKK